MDARIELERKNPDSLVVNLPFDENRHAFYYNHKINCMTAEGYVRTHSHEWTFDPEDSFGILDWGRGVWLFHNEWYWSNGSGWLNSEMFGFNLGCGFGNTDIASENILFYRGTSHKLGKVDFILGKDYMDPWHLRDREGRLDLCLVPVYDRETKNPHSSQQPRSKLTGHQTCNAAELRGIDPCGSRQMCMQACPLGSLPAGIKSGGSQKSKTGKEETGQ